MRRTHRPAGRRGYVLVVTLIVMTVGVMLLAGVSRHSLRSALSSLEQERELQTKWGNASVERVALSNPKRLLVKPSTNGVSAEESEFQVISTRAAQVQLGEVIFSWRLADEQSKINVNLWAENRSDRELEDLVRDFAPASMSVSLSPHDLDSMTRTKVEYQSLGQLVDASPFEPPAAQSRDFISLSSSLTCWGDGATVNIHSAKRETIVTVASLIVSESDAESLAEMRDSNPSLSLAQLLDAMALRLQKREQLERVFVEQSRAWSIWIEAREDSWRRHRLVVKEGVGNSSHRMFVFAF